MRPVRLSFLTFANLFNTSDTFFVAFSTVYGIKATYHTCHFVF